MKQWFTLLVIPFLFYSCLENRENYTQEKLQELSNRILEDPYKYDEREILNSIDKILAKDSTPFIENSFITDSFYQPILKKLKLKAVESYILNDTVEIYRFKYWRSQSRETIILTVQNIDDSHYLFVNSFSLHGKCRIPREGPIHRITGDSCVQIIRSKKIKLSENDWNDYIKVIEDNEFWDLKTTNNRRGLDGSGWTIEGSKVMHANVHGDRYQKYHRVNRWSPPNNSGIRKIGEHLLELSEEDWGKIY